MDVLVYYKNKEEKKPLEREVFWYDSFWKKMEVFNCSKLNYKFVEEEYILTTEGEKITVEAGIKKFVEHMEQNPDKFEKLFYPNIFAEKYLRDNGFVKKESRWKAVPETFNKISSSKDINSLIKFYDNYINYNNSSIEFLAEEDEGILFVISEDSDGEDFLDSLDRQGYIYEIKS